MQKQSRTPVAMRTATFPLQGHRLIEASAGTGKTHTITDLYLRLLLGHGSEQTRFGPPLSPRSILVVTFTDAATQELKQRIRSRIHNAIEIFSARIKNAPTDHLMIQLLSDLDDHSLATQLLTAAAQQMDEASIFTIHGFCHRILRQYAFESGVPFNLKLIVDEIPFLQQAINDFWRIMFYQADDDEARLFYHYWQSPQHLLTVLKPWLSHHILHITTHDSAHFSDRYHRWFQILNKIKIIWHASYHELVSILLNSDIDKRIYSQRCIKNWMNTIQDWAQQKAMMPPPACITKFCAKILQQKTKKNGTFPQHHAFDLITTFLLLPQTFKDIFLSQALSDIRIRFTSLKQEQHVIGFNDLLIQLNNALQSTMNLSLIDAIRHQLPVAIIDEFQDTDSLQYRIFSKIYSKKNTLLMIGDPKQAIYAFRGGDIFTYIYARRMTASHFTLSTNWRATKTMIKACNYLFTRTENPFIYSQDIPFHPIHPAPQASLRVIKERDNTSAAIIIWCQKNKHNKPINKKDYLCDMAQITAQEIQRLLIEKTCTLSDAHQQRAIAASDIAILVRTGEQARKMRSSLTQHGIPSVYMSERDSVFNTQEAKDIYRILHACIETKDERLIRAALATSIIGVNASTLNELKENEKKWETTLKEFNQYHIDWQRHGVLSLLRRLLFTRKIPQSLLQETNGERRLTDIMHIGDLLAFAEQKMDGPRVLIHWLWMQIHNHNHEAGTQLRLESDRNLVKIVTLHKSKGLEYSVVFMPYVCDWQEIETKNGCLFHEEGKSEPTLDFSLKDRSIHHARRERLAEDIRLFYVGITRAIYRCYIGVCPIYKGKIGKNATHTHLDCTAIGHLLPHKDPIEAQQLYPLLCKHWHQSTLIEVRHPEKYLYKNIKNNEIQSPPSCVLPFTTVISNQWMITSYSALTANYISNIPVLSPPITVSEHEHEHEHEHEQNKTIFSFPKGPKIGTLLHTLFENMDFIQAKHTPPRDLIQQLLRCNGLNLEWENVVIQLVHNVLNSLLLPQFSLGTLPISDRYAEMEFMLPMAPLHAQHLNDVIKMDTLSHTAGALQFRKIEGMLRGFIDLVFTYKGQYYIVDYKSNYLGATPECYTDTMLKQEMCKHRYDFQYQLYLLALHRLLKMRLPDYHYDTHIGGVFYLFLRGMKANDRSGVFFTKPNQQLIDQLDSLFNGKNKKTICT